MDSLLYLCIKNATLTFSKSIVVVLLFEFLFCYEQRNKLYRDDFIL